MTYIRMPDDLHFENFFFEFLSILKEYDRNVSFSFDYEPNGPPLGSQSKGKLSLHDRNSFLLRKKVILNRKKKFHFKKRFH